MADGSAQPPELSFAQKLERSRIESSAGVVAGSVMLGISEDGHEVVTFDIATEPGVEAPKADVLDVETILFVYANGRRFGETAPWNVLCARDDFPREVGHLCAGPPGCAAAPCLAIGGTQALYERAGIEALMVRLRDFLRDAKAGSLMADGWEPVPFAVDQELRFGALIPRFFQDHAAGNSGEGAAFGVAINHEKDGQGFTHVFPQIIEPDQMVGAIAFRNEGKGINGRKLGMPWIFLWPDPSHETSEPLFEAWRTGAELRAGLKRLGLDARLDAALGTLLDAQCDFKFHREPLGAKGFVVVVGVWRPAPIMDVFFGYSDDPAARKLELRAYMVSCDIPGDVLADTTRVESIVADYPPRPDLLRWVSGVDDPGPLFLLGHGALGSAIMDNLIRAGVTDVSVQDHDRLKPHNLARHSGTVDDVYRRKSGLATRMVDRVIDDESLVRMQSFDDDLALLDRAVLLERAAGRLIVDATADERVRMRMDEVRAGSADTIVRTEIFHQGRLGATFISLPDGPTLSDMMLAMIGSSMVEPAVASWLAAEDQQPFGPAPLLYGFGCSSQTVKLPKFVVEQHASVACTAIFGQREASGILLNPLDLAQRPSGTRWIPIEPYTVLTPPTEPAWKIRLSAPAMSRMRDERAASLPRETGGYLYGSWDPVSSTITIVQATGLPPDSVATESALELGPAGKSVEERRLKAKTKGRLFLCGTWHSHPNGSARMSGRDHTAMMKHHERDAEHMRPTLIVIVAEGDVQAHLKV